MRSVLCWPGGASPADMSDKKKRRAILWEAVIGLAEDRDGDRRLQALLEADCEIV